MTVRLGRNPQDARVWANCSVVPSRDHISVSADGGAVTMDDGMGLSLWVTVGDMWTRGPSNRSDHLALHGMILPARDTPLRDDGDPTETRVTSTPDSLLSATVEGLRGWMTFDRLVSYPEGRPEQVTPFELSGTISWSCDEPAAPMTGSGR